MRGAACTGNEHERLLCKAHDCHPGAIGANHPSSLCRYVCSVLAHGARRHATCFGEPPCCDCGACGRTFGADGLGHLFSFLSQVIFPALSLIKGLQVSCHIHARTNKPCRCPVVNRTSKAWLFTVYGCIVIDCETVSAGEDGNHLACCRDVPKVEGVVHTFACVLSAGRSRPSDVG